MGIEAHAGSRSFRGRLPVSSTCQSRALPLVATLEVPPGAGEVELELSLNAKPHTSPVMLRDLLLVVVPTATGHGIEAINTDAGAAAGSDR